MGRITGRRVWRGSIAVKHGADPANQSRVHIIGSFTKRGRLQVADRRRLQK
jgi:hypothetical protein